MTLLIKLNNMKTLSIVLLVINIAIIIFGTVFYFKQWQVTQERVNCIQASIATDNPENLFENFKTCIESDS